MIRNFYDFVLEEYEYELYFEGNFTPLYHITGAFREIIKDDTLKVGRPGRGPIGICVTRSKYFEHMGLHKYGRIILNRELLTADGYRSHPIDEWALKKPEGDFRTKDRKWVTKKPWSEPTVLKKNFGKSQFPETLSGKRPISHNIKGLPKDKNVGLEVEYEERILKDIKNVGKYIYAFNFEDEKKYETYKKDIEEYRKKYPHIKVLLGLYHFREA